ncbi:MAG TPA: DUF1697 domain-containing protein [Galbitalea sp.]|jgi:uncharacterized protein (DUF1697 family)|nr:DUF1697 domain-containing protein [Galbitalea sp.]
MTDNGPKRYVLLLRGINVNPTTRVAMAELRAILGDLGFERVSTILQSGNVIADSRASPDVAAIESAIASGTGVTSRLVVLTLDDLRALAAANPLLDVSDDLSKMVITFLDGDIVPSEIDRPTDADLAPERLVIAKRAIYQWCPLGILQSQVKPAWWRQIGPIATTRNVRTVNRILDAADAV